MTLYAEDIRKVLYNILKEKSTIKKITRRFDDSIRATVTAKTKEKERSQDIWIHDFQYTGEYLEVEGKPGNTDQFGKIVKLQRKVTKEWFRMKKIDVDQEQT